MGLFFPSLSRLDPEHDIVGASVATMRDAYMGIPHDLSQATEAHVDAGARERTDPAETAMLHTFPPGYPLFKGFSHWPLVLHGVAFRSPLCPPVASPRHGRAPCALACHSGRGHGYIPWQATAFISISQPSFAGAFLHAIATHRLCRSDSPLMRITLERRLRRPPLSILARSRAGDPYYGDVAVSEPQSD
eukprot:2216927-Pleurochrysis_carterae.AAC.1